MAPIRVGLFTQSILKPLASPKNRRGISNAGPGYTSHPWTDRTYITVQCLRLYYSDRLFNFRIYLLIYSSVGYRNLQHQVIEDSSQHNHFNNSQGTVSIPQILCCIVSPSHSICIGIFVLIHLTSVSNLFSSTGGGAMKTSNKSTS